MTAPALFTSHQNIAYGIAKDYYIPGQEWADTNQDALVALWEAARKYEPTHGCSFPGFARQVIKRRLNDKLKAALRGKQLVLTDAVREVDVQASDDVCFAVLQRERVRSILAAHAALSEPERRTVARMVNGVPMAGKWEDNARYWVRQKLRAAA